MVLTTLTEELKAALKEKNEARASVIRMLISAIQNKEIEVRGKGGELSEQDCLEVLKKELKKRKESADMFQKGGRPELAEKELSEATYIEKFLPAQLSDEDLLKIVDAVLVAHPGATIKDFGMLVKEVIAQAKGQAEGSDVSRLLKEKLG